MSKARNPKSGYVNSLAKLVIEMGDLTASYLRISGRRQSGLDDSVLDLRESFEMRMVEKVPRSTETNAECGRGSTLNRCSNRVVDVDLVTLCLVSSAHSGLKLYRKVCGSIRCFSANSKEVKMNIYRYQLVFDI